MMARRSKPTVATTKHSAVEILARRAKLANFLKGQTANFLKGQTI